MSDKWLLIDVSNLCYRYFFADISMDDMSKVLFGFFRDVYLLKEKFKTDKIAFAFDGGHTKRTEILPMYKENRNQDEMEQEEIEARKELRRNIRKLRVEYLREAGFKNILWQQGFEADDLIASVCENKDRDTKIMIVSSDSDLLQCLCKSVRVYSPASKTVMTHKEFREKHSISPTRWADVKAIAGCRSDNIPGIKGIGEVYAKRFLNGTLKTTGKNFETLTACPEVWERNIKLTLLPIEGTPKITLVDDSFHTEKWDRVMHKLGINSLVQGKRQRRRAR